MLYVIFLAHPRILEMSRGKKWKCVQKASEKNNRWPNGVRLGLRHFSNCPSKNCPHPRHGEVVSDMNSGLECLGLNPAPTVGALPNLSGSCLASSLAKWV